jgi:hypothetical protein
VGGIFGLYTGASIISLIEIVLFIPVLVGKLYRKFVLLKNSCFGTKATIISKIYLATFLASVICVSSCLKLLQSLSLLLCLIHLLFEMFAKVYRSSLMSIIFRRVTINSLIAVLLNEKQT